MPRSRPWRNQAFWAKVKIGSKASINRLLEDMMAVLLFIFIVWAAFAAGVGALMARIEQRVNGLPAPRTKSAVLLSIFLGPIGMIIVAARSNLRFASSMRQSLSGQAVTRQQVLDAAKEIRRQP